MNSVVGIISWHQTDNDDKYISVLRNKAENWMFDILSKDIEKDETKIHFSVEFGGIFAWSYGITGSRDYVDKFCKETIESMTNDGVLGLHYVIYYKNL